MLISTGVLANQLIDSGGLWIDRFLFIILYCGSLPLTSAWSASLGIVEEGNSRCPAPSPVSLAASRSYRTLNKWYPQPVSSRHFKPHWESCETPQARADCLMKLRPGDRVPSRRWRIDGLPFKLSSEGLEGTTLQLLPPRLRGGKCNAPPPFVWRHTNYTNSPPVMMELNASSRGSPVQALLRSRRALLQHDRCFTCVQAIFWVWLEQWWPRYATPTGCSGEIFCHTEPVIITTPLRSAISPPKGFDWDDEHH